MTTVLRSRVMLSFAACAWIGAAVAGQQVASLGWISPIASFTVVAIQFQVGVPAAAVATLAVCTTFVAGTAARSFAQPAA